MPNSSTIGELFQLAIALEHSAEAFYCGLTIKFAHETEIAAFWEKFEREESGHARWLEKLVDRLSEDRLRGKAPAELLASARRLLQTSPETLLAEISNLEEAYQVAIEMENSETNLIFDTLITDFAVSSQAVQFLKVQLKEHAVRIVRAFPSRFDTTAARLAVKART